LVTVIPAVCLACRAPLDLTMEYAHTDAAKWMVCKCPVCKQSIPVHAAGTIARVTEHVRQKRTAS
jgi:hypothetical protein